MKKRLITLAALFGLWTAPVYAQSAASEELAKQLSNPIASLISVPFQLNFDEGYGANGNGRRALMNIQPVIPFSIGEDWNVISRTIVPLIDQEEFAPGTSQSGVGDIVQSLFFSPKAPTANGLIWGVGPVFLLPTASDSALGQDQFAIGPTGVALKQMGPWTIGALANHLWDVGGDNADINATFLQPFVSYTTPNAWTFTANTESTYDWNAEEWSVPLNFTVTKLVTINKQPISIGGGLRYWADSPDGGPDDIGLRFIVTLLFPK